MRYIVLVAATALGLGMSVGAALAQKPLSKQPAQESAATPEARRAIDQARRKLQQAGGELSQAAQALRRQSDAESDGAVADVHAALDRLERAVSQIEAHQTEIDEQQRRDLGELRTALDRRAQTLEQDRAAAAQAFQQLAGQARELSARTGDRHQAARGDPATPVPGGDRAPAAEGDNQQAAPQPQGRDMGRDADGTADPGETPPENGTSERTPQAATDDAAAGDDGERWYHGVRVSDLLGQQVRNQDGDEISDIEHVLVDGDGDAYAVLSVGGFLGIGDKQIMVPLTRMALADNGVVLETPQDEDALKAMPVYDETRSDYSRAAAAQVLGE
jgi:hypothetical protein